MVRMGRLSSIGIGVSRVGVSVSVVIGSVFLRDDHEHKQKHTEVIQMHYNELQHIWEFA